MVCHSIKQILSIKGYKRTYNWEKISDIGPFINKVLQYEPHIFHLGRFDKVINVFDNHRVYIYAGT